MATLTVTIRGLDKELLRGAKASAVSKGISMGRWLNDAISEKLYQESLVVYELDTVAEVTNVEGVFRVPRGTVKLGEDYSIQGRRLCAAGRKGDEEVITYQSPSVIHNQGYRIFWIR